MKIKGVSLLLTLYKPMTSDLIYWSKVFDEFYKKGIEAKVLVDNPKLNVDEYFNKNQIYYSPYNKGKLKLVYDFIKSGEFNQSHFKTIDPDDRMVIGDYYEFITKMKNDSNIYRMKNIRYSGDFNDIYNGKECNSKRLRKFSKAKSYGSSWTILPTTPIENDDFFKGPIGINWLEDQILALICIGNGALNKNIDLGWYIYNDQSGMTSNTDNSDLKKIIRSLKIWWELMFEYKCFRNWKSSFPSRLNYLKKMFLDKREQKIISEFEWKKMINKKLINYDIDIELDLEDIFYTFYYVFLISHSKTNQDVNLVSKVNNFEIMDLIDDFSTNIQVVNFKYCEIVVVTKDTSKDVLDKKIVNEFSNAIERSSISNKHKSIFSKKK